MLVGGNIKTFAVKYVLELLISDLKLSSGGHLREESDKSIWHK